jgi:hypothetical protein
LKSRSLWIDVCVLVLISACGAIGVFFLGEHSWASWVVIVLGVALIGLRIRQAHLNARSQRALRKFYRLRAAVAPEGALLVSERLAQIDQMLASGEISEAEHAAATAQILGNAPLGQ